VPGTKRKFLPLLSHLLSLPPIHEAAPSLPLFLTSSSSLRACNEPRNGASEHSTSRGKIDSLASWPCSYGPRKMEEGRYGDGELKRDGILLPRALFIRSGEGEKPEVPVRGSGNVSPHAMRSARSVAPTLFGYVAILVAAPLLPSPSSICGLASSSSSSSSA
jgi:hypothetical protein